MGRRLMSAFRPAPYPFRPDWPPALNRPLSALPAEKFNFLQLTLALYVFFLPVQFVFGQIESSQINIAVSDIFLFLALLLGYSHFRLKRAAWSIFHPALVLMFFYGAAI